MNKLSGLRIAFALVIVVLVAFSVAPPFRTNAESTPCQQEARGWTTIDGTQVDLEGTWMIRKSTNCKNGWNWSSPMTITEERGGLEGKAWGNRFTIQLSSAGIVMTRDISPFPDDKFKSHTQTFRGYVQRAGRSIRIFGKWSGAYDYTIPEGYNNEFKISKL